MTEKKYKTSKESSQTIFCSIIFFSAVHPYAQFQTIIASLHKLRQNKLLLSSEAPLQAASLAYFAK